MCNYYMENRISWRNISSKKDRREYISSNFIIGVKSANRTKAIEKVWYKRKILELTNRKFKSYKLRESQFS